MSVVAKAVVSIVAALATASLLALPDEAWAGRGGGRHGGGKQSGSRSGHSHHHVHRSVLIGGALFYPWPYSYYFQPLLPEIQEPWPVVYVEQFPGTPTPDTKDWIYCPGKAASYPDVTECPGGWQRVIPLEQAIHQAPAP
jgi:hypothetical protein